MPLGQQCLVLPKLFEAQRRQQEGLSLHSLENKGLPGILLLVRTMTLVYAFTEHFFILRKFGVIAGLWAL